MNQSVAEEQTDTDSQMACRQSDIDENGFPEVLEETLHILQDTVKI